MFYILLNITILIKNKFLIAGLFLSFLLFATPALAQTGKPTGTPPFKRGLTELKLRSCEARQDAIKTRMNSLIRLVTNMEEKFDAIAQRVKDFYTSSGKTIPNYDALVADIQAKKDVVSTDLAKAQADVDAFSCTGDDPKGILTTFRLDMQKVKSDLKAFRTSIKNLIVAVRGLAPTPEATGTPEPTPTTTATPTATSTPTATP